MTDAARAYPDDVEVAIFHALSLLAVAYNSPPDKTYALQKEAASILNGLLPNYPDHPGIAHYMIHSFDYPELASLALPAARAYAAIAPDATHALHMPAHIFIRLGLWQESIKANLASAEAGTREAERRHPGASSFNALHATDYLVYAYLQTAQDSKARELVDRINAVTALDDPEAFAAGFAMVAVPARYALERHQWREAANLPDPPNFFPWDKLPYAGANTEFARAVGAARSGDVERRSTEPGATDRDPAGHQGEAEGLRLGDADRDPASRRQSAGWPMPTAITTRPCACSATPPTSKTRPASIRSRRERCCRHANSSRTF